MKLNKKKNLGCSMTIVFLLTLISNTSIGQCISGNCESGEGVYVLASGSRYEGLFTDGQPHGKGKMMFASGDVYQGEFANGEFTGTGKYTHHDGSSFSGVFKNGDLLEGSIVDNQGGISTGKFSGDRIYGIGTYKASSGETYQGNFVEGEFSGQGTWSYSNGDRYDGEFKNGLMHGKGILSFQKGGTLKGTWIKGEYVSGPSEGSVGDIKLTEDSGVLIVKVLINGVPVNMIFDTGASLLNLTPDILLPAFRNGTITEDDVLGGGQFMDATGNINMNVIINIREVQIGNEVLHDVQASVANSMDGTNLFGLSGIRKLGNVYLDFDRLLLRGTD